MTADPKDGEPTSAMVSRQAVLDALHEHLPYPTEACAIVRAMVAASPPDQGRVEHEALIEWAHEQSAAHHRLAHQNKPLRTQHIASSAAYRELAEKLAALTNKDTAA